MSQYLPQKPAAIPLIAALAANSHFLYGNIGVMTTGIVPYVLDQSSSETVKATNWFIAKGKVRSLLPASTILISNACAKPAHTLSLSFNNRTPSSPLPLPLALSLAPRHFTLRSLESGSLVLLLLCRCLLLCRGRSYSCCRSIIRCKRWRMVV